VSGVIKKMVSLNELNFFKGRGAGCMVGLHLSFGFHLGLNIQFSLTKETSEIGVGLEFDLRSNLVKASLVGTESRVVTTNKMFPWFLLS